MDPPFSLVDAGKIVQALIELDLHEPKPISSQFASFLEQRGLVLISMSNPDSKGTLTVKGSRYVQAVLAGLQESTPEQPHWDVRRRELWYGRILVKRMRKSSPNQQYILSAFQERDWPLRIEDPIPAVPEIDAGTRLHDAIKRLNIGMSQSVIRFGGDGTGCGVIWRLALRGPDRKKP